MVASLQRGIVKSDESCNLDPEIKNLKLDDPKDETDPAQVSRTPFYAVIDRDSTATGVLYPIEECMRFRL